MTGYENYTKTSKMNISTFFFIWGVVEWVEPNIDIPQISGDSAFGYILVVDLNHPESLHDLHKDLPFCAEHPN